MNKATGSSLRVAFDVDDTLIIPAIATDKDIDIPNYETIAIYNWFKKQGYYMIIWSGGGEDYARMWGEKLGLEPNEYRAKAPTDDIDIAFDDSKFLDLGARVNVQVKRINNKVIRYPDKIK